VGHMGLTVIEDKFRRHTCSEISLSMSKRVRQDKKFKLVLKSMLSRGIRFQI